MEGKVRSIGEKKEVTQNHEQIAVDQQSDKTKEHLIIEKGIKHANSVYDILR